MKRGEGTIKTSKTISVILCALVLFLVAAALVRSLTVEPSGDRLMFGEAVSLRDKWEQPHVAREDGGEYAYTIPSDSGNQLTLSLMNFGGEIEVQLDGEIIYTYEDTYGERGFNVQWIPLPEDAAGKKLTLRSPSGDSHLRQTAEAGVYLGDRAAIFSLFLQRNLHVLVFGVFSLFMSTALFACALYFRKKIPDSNYRSMGYLGIFIFLAGIWVFSDSQLAQLFTGRTAVIWLLSFATFMTMPIFMLLFLREMLLEKAKVLDFLCFLYGVVAAGSMAVYLFRLVPLYQTLPVVHILILCTIVLILRLIVREIRDSGNREIKRIALGVGLLSACAVISLVVFYIDHTATIYPRIYSIGIFLFSLCLIDAVLLRLYFHMEMSASTVAYQQLAYKDQLTGLRNRTAFMEEIEKTDASCWRTFIVLDVNGLKEINDQYGHLVGDQAIIDVAASIREVFASEGHCYRIGGDEFVVILDRVSEKETSAYLSELDDRLQQLNVGRAVPVEVAWGYSSQDGRHITPQTFFEEADRNMYRRKQAMKIGNIVR